MRILARCGARMRTGRLEGRAGRQYYSTGARVSARLFVRDAVAFLGGPVYSVAHFLCSRFADDLVDPCSRQAKRVSDRDDTNATLDSLTDQLVSLALRCRDLLVLRQDRI